MIREARVQAEALNSSQWHPLCHRLALHFAFLKRQKELAFVKFAYVKALTKEKESTCSIDWPHIHFAPL